VRLVLGGLDREAVIAGFERERFDLHLLELIDFIGFPGSVWHIGRARGNREVAMGWIVLLIIIGIVLVLVSMYNRLVTARNAFKNAFAQIDVQLTRRYDLIPNLVETAKGYIKHERETLEAVVNARNAAYAGLKTAASDPGNAAAVRQLSGADQLLGGALGRLLAVAESYPDLKANQNMMQLSEELTSTENKVAFARQAYNDAVMTYNNAREVFPSSLVAGTFNFQPAQPLEIARPEAREAPKVSFS
jgi:LemA protein